MPLALTKFDCLQLDLGLAKHNLDADNLGLALSNVLPDAALDTVLGDITQIAAGSGYVAGGPTIANTEYSLSGAVGILIGDDVTFSASGGPMAGFQYPVLYNKTHVSLPLICFWDRGSTLVLGDGESWLFDFSAVNGIIQIQ